MVHATKYLAAQLCWVVCFVGIGASHRFMYCVARVEDMMGFFIS